MTRELIFVLFRPCCKTDARFGWLPATQSVQSGARLSHIVTIALRSNIRWRSDHFERACRNGEIVRVLFAINACDREVMAWVARSAGISGEMVRDLMVACVERLLGISKAGHPVEWSDNGWAYIAKDTLDTATALGLKLCFTPIRLPESNGIAEAFVNFNLASGRDPGRAGCFHPSGGKTSA